MKRKNKKKRNRSRYFIRFFLLSALCVLFILFIYEYYRNDLIHFQRQLTERTGIFWAEIKKKYHFFQEEDNMPPLSFSCLYGEVPFYEENCAEQVIWNRGYTVAFYEPYRNARWVAYELTREKNKGKIKRKNQFMKDPSVQGVCADHKDFYKSGYDRGHLAPAADMKWDSTAMIQSFYYTNICPQNPSLNKGLWKILEDRIRYQADNDSVIWIACGPIFEEKRQTMGDNQIVVPDAFFKVIVSPYTYPPKGIGFVFQNEALSGRLKDYVLTIDSVEKLTNIDFFHRLPDSLENWIESRTRTEHWEYIFD